jgi:phosphatidylglycerophosphatase A
MTRAAVLLATWFGCGLSPVAPGTVGSAAAIAVAWGLHTIFGWRPWMFPILAAVMLVPAVWASGVTAIASGKDDPGKVVVDEVLGQWVALGGAIVLDWKMWLAAFLLFRVFDVVKPFPLRRLEKLHGGTGIVADDLGAGIYSALVLYAIG